ncbi:hypothetical protein JHD50_10630 [Sulfurimonas sp. MAG313]|nr:hypothetical protein [Sulfurimonas sp. MAG313]MDF1881747.1 hypothetical protein [Sulfurimonas sp. MAG313]
MNELIFNNPTFCTAVMFDSLALIVVVVAAIFALWTEPLISEPAIITEDPACRPLTSANEAIVETKICFFIFSP